jgi:hypothetical protein
VKNRPKPDELSPYERFREFARRIVAVPKSEVDKQQAQYERERAEKKVLRSAKGAR